MKNSDEEKLQSHPMWRENTIKSFSNAYNSINDRIQKQQEKSRPHSYMNHQNIYRNNYPMPDKTSSPQEQSNDKA